MTEQVFDYVPESRKDLVLTISGAFKTANGVASAVEVFYPNREPNGCIARDGVSQWFYKPGVHKLAAPPGPVTIRQHLAEGAPALVVNLAQVARPEAPPSREELLEQRLTDLEARIAAP